MIAHELSMSEEDRVGVVVRGESTNLAINGSDNDVAAVRGPLEIEDIFTQRGSQPYAIQR